MSKSLQDVLDEAGNAVDYLRSPKYDRNGPSAFSPGLIMPQVPFEFSSWQREARSWHEGVALFDQTHHMNGLHVTGPDALRFLSGLACNNLSKTAPAARIRS